MDYSDRYKVIITDSVDTCLSLLEMNTPKHVGEIKSKVEFMVSCSRLEDHWNIWYILNNTESIIDSLLTGHKLTIELKLIISKCLCTIKTDVGAGNHNIDRDLMAELIRVVDEIKRNERDFIYDKDFRCLLISSDKFLCDLIVNSIDSSIKITILEDIQSLFERNFVEEFDIVICNIVTNDLMMSDFIMTFSKRIPIVAICRSDDVQLIMNSAKLGIKHLISSDTFGIRYLSKTIHTVYSEWIKEMKRFTLRPVLENHVTRLVLRDMLLTELPIQQKVKSHFANELEVNSVIKDSYDIKVNELIKTDFLPIDFLVRDKYLTKIKVKSTLICPNCESVDSDTTYLCTRCSGNLFEKYSEIYSHIKCGYNGLKNSFVIGNKFYCPRCKESIPDLSLLKKGIFFRCNECQELFKTPLSQYKCNFCEFGPFGYIEGKLQTLYKFDLNPLLEKQFKKHFLILQKLGEYLEQIDFRVAYDMRPSDNPHSEIYYDLVAVKEEIKIIVVILSSDLEHNIEMLYHIDHLRDENKKVSPIIVSLSEPNRLVLNLLLKLKIFNIISDNDKEILKRSLEYVNVG